MHNLANTLLHLKHPVGSYFTTFNQRNVKRLPGIYGTFKSNEYFE
jgi:hypothetical protein